MSINTKRIVAFALGVLVVLAGAQCWSAAGDISELIDALKRNDVEEVQRLLNVESVKRNINARGEGGVSSFTALQIAAIGGDTWAVKLLLDAGARVDIGTELVGSTALMLAARYGKNQVVGLLLDANANVNARNLNGATALMMAAEDGYYEIVRRLLDAGADADIRANNHQTALDMARVNGDAATIAMLQGWQPQGG